MRRTCCDQRICHNKDRSHIEPISKAKQRELSFLRGTLLQGAVPQQGHRGAKVGMATKQGLDVSAQNMH